MQQFVQQLRQAGSCGGRYLHVTIVPSELIRAAKHLVALAPPSLPSREAPNSPSESCCRLEVTFRNRFVVLISQDRVLLRWR
jgi:hypothetical protein